MPLMKTLPPLPYPHWRKCPVGPMLSLLPRGARVAQFTCSVGVRGTWGPIPFIQRNHLSGSDPPPLPSYQALPPRYKKLSACFVSRNLCGRLESLTTPHGPTDGETEALAGEVTCLGWRGAASAGIQTRVCVIWRRPLSPARGGHCVPAAPKAYGP